MKRETITPVKTGRPRRKSEAVNGAEARYLDVYRCADGYNPLVSTSGAKEELLGRMPYSDNFIKDAARRFGGGRYLYFIPINGDGTWGSGTAQYCPKVIDSSTDDDKLKDAQRNGSHSSLGELTEAVKFVEEIKRQAAPQQKPIEILRDLKEASEFFHPQREANPVPQQSNDSSSVRDKILDSIIQNSEGAAKEKAIEMAFEWLKGEKSGQDVLTEFLHGPQLIPAIQTAGNVLLGILDRVWGPRQAQVSTQPPQQPSQQAPPQSQVAQQAQSLPEAAVQQAQATQQEFIPPEQQALSLLVNHCVPNHPVKIAFDRLMAYADAVNEQAPQYSIDGYIEMLATTPTDAVIEYLKTLPNGAQVANLPHTRTWCEQLQRIIRDNFLDDEGADGNEFAQFEEIGDGEVKL